MKISYDYHSYNRIGFSLSPDEMDAVPSVSSIYFHGPKVGRLKKQRAVAIGFLAFRHLIGNVIDFDNMDVDPHLAGQMRSAFEGDELFISPITNVPTKISLTENGAGLILFGNEASGIDAPVVLKLDDLGIGFETTVDHVGQPEGYIRSNVKLALVGQAVPVDSAFAIIASLLAADLFGVSRFLVRDVVLGADEVAIAKEAGVHVST